MMGMTREEAIRALRVDDGLEIRGDATRLSEFLQGLFVAIAALRGPTREMVERMRGEWIHDGPNFEGGTDWYHCSKCGKKEVKHNFCSRCGSPMTDEAVDMMLERWKEAADGETD